MATALPAIVVVLVDWMFWGIREKQAGWGVNIDGLALFTAFIVALAVSGPAREPDEPVPSFFDGLMQRLALASFGLVAASACGALFAFIRLSSICVGPELHSMGAGGRSVLMALALIMAPPFVWLCRQSLMRAPHALRLLLGIVALGFSGWLSFRPEPSGARLEYLRAAFEKVVALPALNLDVQIERVSFGGASFDYLAVADNCVLRPVDLEPNRRIASQSAAIPPSSSSGGFAVCPAIDVYEGNGQIFGHVRGTALGGKPLFRIVAGRISNDPVIDGLYAMTPSSGEKIAALPSIRAPRGITSDKDSGDGVTIKRDASSHDHCSVRVEAGGEVLYEGSMPFGGTGKIMEACQPVTVTRSPVLGILNLDVPGTVSVGSAEPPPTTWLDGKGYERVSLRTVAGRVNTPKAWRLGAQAGLAAGALGLVYALVEITRLRRLRGFIAADHQGGGKIALSDGAIIDAEAARGLEVGEVFVRGALPAVRLAGYREPAQETAPLLEVRSPADFSTAWERSNGRVTFASAIAVTFPIATVALLAAARVFGLGG